MEGEAALQKYMSKEGGEPVQDEKRKAKESVLEELRDMMGGMMGEKVKGLKKVEVAAPTEEGLEEGLETAKDVVEAMPEEGGETEMPMSGEEGEESMEMPDEDMSVEEIDEMIAYLQEMKASKGAGESEEPME